MYSSCDSVGRNSYDRKLIWINRWPTCWWYIWIAECMLFLYDLFHCFSQASKTSVWFNPIKTRCVSVDYVLFRSNDTWRNGFRFYPFDCLRQLSCVLSLSVRCRHCFRAAVAYVCILLDSSHIPQNHHYAGFVGMLVLLVLNSAYHRTTLFPHSNELVFVVFASIHADNIFHFACWSPKWRRYTKTDIKNHQKPKITRKALGSHPKLMLIAAPLILHHIFSPEACI